MIPMIEEVVTKLSNKAVYTVVDLQEGFWQI